MIGRLLRILPALLPLAAGLALLRLMPLAALGLEDAAQAPPVTYRLDPLALAALALLPLGAAAPRRTLFQSLRLLIGVVLGGLALVTPEPILQSVLLAGLSLLLVDGLSPRWLVALAAVLLANLLPEAAKAGWLAAPSAQNAFLPLLIAAAFIGLGGLPWGNPRSTISETHATRFRALREITRRFPKAGQAAGFEWALRPLWLFPLLRTMQGGPWPSPWPLVVPLLGTAGAVWAAYRAFTTSDGQQVIERVSAAMLLMALVCAGFNSAVGVAGALWSVVAHALLLLWARAERWHGSPAPLFLSLFLAVWWATAAASSGRAFLLAAMVWLAGCVATAALVWRQAPDRPRGANAAALLVVCLLAGLLMVFTPLVTRFVARPVIDQLDPGLTPFGLLDTWPWIGVAALDPGHRRTELWPSVALVPLFLAPLAITWLLLRIITRPPREEPMELPTGETLADRLGERVWWTRRRHG